MESKQQMEKENLDQELSALLEATLKLEDELNYAIAQN